MVEVVLFAKGYLSDGTISLIVDSLKHTHGDSIASNCSNVFIR